MKCLIFGDSNTTDFITNDNVTIEKHYGLGIFDPMFTFLFEDAIKQDNYEMVILCIGTNDIGKGYTIYELKEKINNLDSKIITIGPGGTINTAKLKTIDGVHFTKKSINKIKKRLRDFLI